MTASTTNRLSALRHKASSAAVVLASSVVTLFLMEFAVRLALPAYDPSGHLQFVAETDDRPLLGRPNVTQRQIKNTGDFDITVHFNKYGMRDAKDFSASKTGDLFLVGDSFAFGWGVKTESRLSEVLETLTGKRVYNLSSGGGDLKNYELLLEYARNNGAAKGPAIIAINMENDLVTYDEPDQGSRKKLKDTSTPGPTIKKKPPFQQTFRLIKAKLTEYSALYFMTTTLVHGSPALRSLAIKAGLITPNLKGVKARTYDPGIISSSAERLKALLENSYGMAILIPSRANWVGIRKKETRKIHNRFSAELKRLRIPAIDLLPAFESTGDPLRFYFKNDAHWNPMGHRLAAKVIAAYIQASAK